MVSAAHSKSLLPLAKGKKVADRPDEGVIRWFCRLEILIGVARWDSSDKDGLTECSEVSRSSPERRLRLAKPAWCASRNLQKLDISCMTR